MDGSPADPRDLREKFDWLVQQFSIWTPSRYEPAVDVGGKTVGMTAICDLAEPFRDQLPNISGVALLSYMNEWHGELKAELARDFTYATAARCFRILIQDKKQMYEDIERRTKSPGT
jgi:hypothetical protein